MAKTILIPTDFRVQSLNTVKLALGHIADKEMNVILLYSEILSDSITDLLFYSPEKIIEGLRKPEFEKALAIIKNRFENSINSLRIELLHGYNRFALDNFLKAHRVDEIYVPKNYTLKPPRLGFDPVPLLKKSGLPVHEIAWDLKTPASETDQLDELFN